MTVPRQHLQLPFAKGLNQDTAEHAQAPGELVRADNVRMNRGGQLEKRKGSALVNSNPNSGTRSQLIAAGTRLMLASDSVLYSAPRGISTLAAIGNIGACTAERTDLNQPPGQPFYVQVAHAGSYAGVVYEATNDQNATVRSVYFAQYSKDALDAVHPVTIVASSVSSVQSRPQMIAIGSTFYIVVVWPGSKLRVFKYTAGSTSATTADIASDADGSGFTVHTDGTYLFVTYRNGGVATLKVNASSLAVLATHTIGTSAGRAIAMHATATRVWVALAGSGESADYVQVYGVNPSTMATVGTYQTPTVPLVGTVKTLTVYGDDTVWSLAITVSTGTVTGDNYSSAIGLARGTTASTTIQAAVNLNYWSYPVSRMFAIGSTLYQVWAHGPTTKSVFMVKLDFSGVSNPHSASTPEAMVAANLITDLTGFADSHMANVELVSGSEYRVGFALNRDNAGRAGVSSATFNFADTRNGMSVSAAGVAYIASGYLMRSEGTSAAEVGFWSRPQIISAVHNGSVGATGEMTAGTRFYKCVWTCYDDNGNVEWSAVSDAVEYESPGGDDSSFVKMPTYPLTRKQLATNDRRQVLCTFYRTIEGGSTFYRLRNISEQARNSVTSEVVTIWDRESDEDIQTRPGLYTAGGRVDSVAVPGVSAVLLHKGRIFAVTDDHNTVWFSQPLVEGEVASFSDGLTLPFLDDPEITALGSLDGNMIAFGRRSVYVVPGDGPSQDGNNNLYPDPTRIATDWGCTEPRSVVSTKQGLMYLSPFGIALLDRSLQSAHFGKRVVDEITAYPTVTGAIVHPTEETVILTCHNGSTGIRLVWDSAANQWYRDDVYSTAALTAIRSMLELEGTIYWVDNNGHLCKEDTTTYLDRSHWVTVDVELSGIRVAGDQGWQRIWRVGLRGERMTAHDMSVQWMFDDSGTYERVRTFNNDATALTADEILQCFVNRACRAFRVRFTDATPTSGTVGTGYGAKLKSLSLTAGVKRGALPRASYQRG